MSESSDYQPAVEWRQRWPNHCAKCHGAGEFSWSESVPYGSTTASMPMADPCDECTYIGKCARCGEFGLRGSEDDGFEGPCKACGWNFDDCEPEPDAIPDCFYDDSEPLPFESDGAAGDDAAGDLAFDAARERSYFK
jgi:hypothetical protein